MLSLVSSAADHRLAKATLAALCLHLAIIFGLNFEWSSQRAKTPMLEITLAVNNADNPPQQADFLAQANQQGSGDSTKTEAIYSQLDTPYIGQQTDAVADNQDRQRRYSEQHIISLDETSAWLSSQPAELEQSEQIDVLTERNLSQDIESVQAHLDNLKNNYAKMPRVTRLNSVSTAYAAEAAYLLAWQQKVEKTGNRFYPSKAKALGIEGDVRLMVAILPNGKIKEVSMLSSSGHTILDQAARSIVHLAGPFKPFPLEIAEKTDILEIIRTWQFRNERLSSRVN